MSAPVRPRRLVALATAVTVLGGAATAQAAPSVRAGDIAKGAVTAKKLRKGAVRSAAIKDGTIALVDLAPAVKAILDQIETRLGRTDKAADAELLDGLDGTAYAQTGTSYTKDESDAKYALKADAREVTQVIRRAGTRQIGNGTVEVLTVTIPASTAGVTMRWRADVDTGAETYVGCEIRRAATTLTRTELVGANRSEFLSMEAAVAGGGTFEVVCQGVVNDVASTLDEQQLVIDFKDEVTTVEL